MVSGLMELHKYELSDQNMKHIFLFSFTLLLNSEAVILQVQITSSFGKLLKLIFFFY